MFSSGIVIIIRLGQKVSSRGVACDEFIVKLLWIPVFSQIISHPISLPHENTKWHAKSIILRLPYSYPLANSLFIKPAEKSFFCCCCCTKLLCIDLMAKELRMRSAYLPVFYFYPLALMPGLLQWPTIEHWTCSSRFEIRIQIAFRVGRQWWRICEPFPKNAFGPF